MSGGITFGEIMNEYKCHICGKIFEKVDNFPVRCAVNHPPGVCCHYREQELVQCLWCGGLIKPGKKNNFGYETDIWVHISPYWPANHEMCAPSFARPKKS
jgi:ribosomal protein S27E